jgi:hypothetical protein
VAVEKADDRVIVGQQRGRAEDAAGDGVVVADDSVLDGVRQREQDDEIEGIQLDKFPFSRQWQHNHQKEVNDYRRNDLLQYGQGNYTTCFSTYRTWRGFLRVRRLGIWIKGCGEQRSGKEYHGGAEGYRIRGWNTCTEGQSCLGNRFSTEDLRFGGILIL